MAWNPHLIHYWKLNESGTDSVARDYTGSWDLTRTGGSWVTGKFGNAYSFSGTNGVKQSVDFTQPDSMTIEFWVKSTGSENEIPLFWLSSNPQDYMDLLIYEGSGWFFSWIRGSPDNVVGDSFDWATSTWYHLAIVITPTQYKIYRDGILKDTNTRTMSSYDETVTFVIGSPAVAFQPDGLVFDEVRVWDVERTQAEIIETMNSELPLKSARSNLLKFGRC